MTTELLAPAKKPRRKRPRIVKGGIDLKSVGKSLDQMREAARLAHEIVRIELKRVSDGREVDSERLMRYIKDWVYILSKIVEYEFPKLVAHRHGGDGDNNTPIPIDIKSLKDDQLYQLIDRLSGLPDAN